MRRRENVEMPEMWKSIRLRPFIPFVSYWHIAHLTYIKVKPRQLLTGALFIR